MSVINVHILIEDNECTKCSANVMWCWIECVCVWVSVCVSKEHGENLKRAGKCDKAADLDHTINCSLLDKSVSKDER